MFAEINSELARIGVKDARATPDRNFEPEAGELAKLCIDGAEWRLAPAELLELLKPIPDGAGGEAVKTAIESSATHVYHGPAPEGSRDTQGA